MDEKRISKQQRKLEQQVNGPPGLLWVLKFGTEYDGVNQVDGQSLVASHFCLLVLVLNTLDQGRSRIGLSGGRMTDDEVWKQPSMD